MFGLSSFSGTKKSILCFVMVSLSTGCVHRHIRASSSYKVGQIWETDFKKLPGHIKPDKEWTVSHGLWGLAGHPVIDIRKVCRRKAFAQAKVSASFGQAVVQVLTLGLYIPSTAQVYCKEKREKGDPKESTRGAYYSANVCRITRFLRDGYLCS